MVSHPFFLPLFFRFNVFAVPLTSGIPSVASRGRETKVSGHVVERCLSCCVNRVLVQLSVVFTDLHVAFLIINAVFSLLCFALRFELNPTGAPSSLNSNRAQSIRREGQPDRLFSSI